MITATSLPRSLLSAFHSAYPGHSPDVFVRAPGRVNLLGGHVDIHEGCVINIAINREIWLAAAFGSSDLVRLRAHDLDESAAFSLKRLASRQDVVGETLPRWAQYPAGMAWVFQREGRKVNGINAVFMGDVVMRAGLSSSAAVEIAFAIAWEALEGWKTDPALLAQYGRDAERDYIGIGTGIQDQFTSLMARPDQALCIDCRTLEGRHLPLPAGARVVVCDTNTRRELVGSHYNQRAEDAHAAAHTIRLVDRRVKTLRDVSPPRLEEFQPLLSDDQYRRARHVVTEIARVQQGVEALEAGDLAQFGALMDASYWSARQDYGSSSPALDAMWRAATDHPACYGARYSGGGDGGAVVALVAAGAEQDFMARTAALYRESTGLDGNLFVVEAVGGAGVLF